MRSIKCSNCGGEVENGICTYCRTKLGDEDQIFSDNLDEYMNVYNNIRLKFETGKRLTPEEDEVFKNLLKYNVLSDNEIDDLRIMCYFLNQIKLFSYETFELLIKRTTEKNMRQMANSRIPNYNPKAFILNLNNCNGSAIKHHVVNLDKNIIEHLYNGNPESLITYYHEIEHIAQSMSFELGLIYEGIITMIKDFVIKEVDNTVFNKNDYYYDNYYNISYEIDAEQSGINSVKGLFNYLNNLGIKTPLIDFDAIRRSWPQEDNAKRKVRVDGEIVERKLDDLFLEMINLKPMCFDKYPQLALLYIKEDNKIRPRTKEELEEALYYFRNDAQICKYLENTINSMDSSTFTN